MQWIQARRETAFDVKSLLALQQLGKTHLKYQGSAFLNRNGGGTFEAGRHLKPAGEKY